MSVTPCLLFNGNAEEAVDFYVSLVPNSRIVETARHDGKPLLITLRARRHPLPGAERPGRPLHRGGLADGHLRDPGRARPPSGTASPRPAASRMMCGWIKDRYGLSWQVVPAGSASG